MVVPPTSSLKSSFRKTLRSVRAAFAASLSGDERASLEASLTDILLANIGPGEVAGYRAFGSEIGVALPRPMAYPRVGASDGLTFHLSASDELVPGYGGIREPGPDATAVSPDIVLVPLIAVDRAGNRLGQGAGHYDRTLADLRRRKKIVAVGIAWDCQLVESLDADPWDQPLDALATPSRWITFEPR